MYLIAFVTKSNLLLLSFPLQIVKIISYDKSEDITSLNSYRIKLGINIELIPHFLNKNFFRGGQDNKKFIKIKLGS